jgi:hypothetical protein
MTKRDSGTRHAKRETTTSSVSGATTADPIEQRLVTFAEQQGRSGGTVDAPGKRRRKPTRNEPSANVAHSQADKLRTAKTMKKTHRRRGRG